MTTRSARVRLKNGLHWRGIDVGVHLGYRKARHGGSWLVRFSVGKSYKRIDLGAADDVFDVGTLSYNDALKAARGAVAAARRKIASDALRPALTIRYAIEHYVTARDARDSQNEGRTVRSDGSIKLNRHVANSEQFLSIRLDELTEDALEAWRNSLDPKLKGTTKRRILNDLKAALNATYRKERRRLLRSSVKSSGWGSVRRL
jgi:hypothetical protein